MSTLTWDHYCGSSGGAGREWSSCWSRPGPSRALPKNSGVRMYERMHHTTILQAQGPLAESGRGAGTPAASHLGRWCQLRRRGVSKVLELCSISKDIQGVCDRNASFLFAIFKTADYLRYLLHVASMPVGMSDAVYMRIVSLLANEALVSAWDRRTYEKMKWLNFQRPKLGIRSAYKVVSEHDWFHTQN